MAVSVSDVMRYCRNYFEDGYLDGTFRIRGNVLEGVTGAHYVYISGSMMHNGVWEMCDGYLTGRSVEGLHDEEFDGRVWFLAPPLDFLGLCKDIVAFEKKNPVGAYASESFGTYNYTRFSGANGLTGWQAAFGAYLRPYMHPFTEVR